MKKYLSALVLLAVSTTFPVTALAAESDDGSNWQAETNDNGTTVSSQSDAVAKADHERMEKLQQQYEAELTKMEQLRTQYEAELKKMNTSDSNYASLKKDIDRIQISGFVRAKYDNDDKAGIGSQNNNKHFYMDFEGKMRVSDEWDAHFQSETRKGYTVNQSWRDNSSSSDQDGTFQRIWVEGRPGKLGVVVGTKWWGYGFQNVPFGHAADGAQLSYNITPDWNVAGFILRPRQGDLVTMPNGSDTTIKGINITGKLAKNLETSITYAGNSNNNNEQKMSRMGAFELRTHPAKNLVLTGTYVRTNADDYKTSQEYRLDYKGTDLSKVGSFGAYVRYVNFQKYGDYSHDDEWGSLPSDTRGWIFGVKYVPYKNVEWETFYAPEKRNIASDNTEYRNATRHLFRTQIDFHF